MDLLRLPYLGQQKILQLADPASVVNFALSSEECARIVKTINLYVEDLRLVISGESCRIELKFFYHQKKFSWAFMPSQTSRIVKYYRNKTISETMFPYERMMLAADFVTKVIRFPVSSVSGNGETWRMQELVNSRLIKQVDKVQLTNTFIANPCRFELKELEVLLINQCNWFTTSSLEAWNPKYLKIKTPYFSSWMTNLFIQDCCNLDKNGKLRRIVFYGKYNKVQILEDLNSKRFEKGRRQEIYPGPKPLDCKLGYDIERKDGLLSTIVFGRERIDFVFWHERFPGDNYEF
ncbi:F-box domain-containing protein [Caenorhabditis elegans]|uniref:F-box domain-containing protein n=1 Tax=Caenorhabditis elegans TaxID=6239 RepID=O45575_CAEEL|nr:F-box domain-containing protein [Caenorhabditis elegans]CAB05744.2 F-box domain-containing protein [Caenorhabditis elegans]|eukprot:NP_499732.2 Uncharacterized protein CELE_F56A8.4 [Caenorhabditis elegans]